MKRKILLCTLLLSVLLLGGCMRNTNTKQENSSVAESVTPSTAENNQTTVQSQPNATQNNNDTNMILEEEAKQIALNHAGFTTDQVTFIKCSLDQDYNNKHYDVEFYTNDNIEYDYEIDAYTGDIIEWDIETIKG